MTTTIPGSGSPEFDTPLPPEQVAPLQWGGDYIKLSEVQNSGVNAGGFTSGAWQTRTINTENNDTGGHCSLAANQFTLQAGTYRIYASAPAYNVSYHRAMLYNISDAADEIMGSSQYTENAHNVVTRSFVVGEFTIASAKTFEIQHRCSITQASSGFGLAVGFGQSEEFTAVELWKVK